MLQLTDVHVRYGGIHAAKGVSMRVAPGGIVTLIGANGAGKSTILRAIAGLVPQRTGSIVFMGKETPMRTHDIVKLGSPWRRRAARSSLT